MSCLVTDQLINHVYQQTLPPYGHNNGFALGETKTHAYKAKGDEVWAHGTMEFSIPFEHVAVLGGIGELYGVTFVGDKMACMGMMDLL